MKRWMSSLTRRIKPALGLMESSDFRKLWGSFTITTFGAQVTNLALPLTAALMLHATPWEMGILVALEVLPFGLLGLFAQTKQRQKSFLQNIFRLRVTESQSAAVQNHGRSFALI